MIVKCIENKFLKLSIKNKSHYGYKDENYVFSELEIGKTYTVYILFVNSEGIQYELFLDEGTFIPYPDEFFEVIDSTPSKYWKLIKGPFENFAFLPEVLDNDEFKTEFWVTGKNVTNLMLLKELMDIEFKNQLKLIENQESLIIEEYHFLKLIDDILNEQSEDFIQYEITYERKHFKIEETFYSSKTDIIFYHSYQIINHFSFYYSIHGEKQIDNISLINEFKKSIKLIKEIALKKIIDNE